MNTKNKALEKILKCLRLAENSAASPQEAETALRQAQKLMEEHRISQSDLLSAEANETAVKAGTVSKIVQWEGKLAKRCAAAFGCEVHFEEHFKVSNWVFIGVDINSKIASYAYTVLYRKCKKARKNYQTTQLKRCQPKTKIKRADLYCEGWVFTACDKLSNLTLSQREEQAIEAYRATKNLTTLKPINRNDGKLTNRQVDDLAKGLLDGKTAQLNNGVAGSVSPRQLEHKGA